jgi:hypothetical protein
MDSSGNSVAQAIDGATGDWSMSGDAMRWSPELAEQGRADGALHSIELAAGAGLGLDVAGMRRLVSGALTSLGAVATDVVNDVVSELRALTRGTPEDDDR